MKQLVLVLALLALVPPTASADVFKLSADWSDLANPNSVWSYWAGGALGVAGTRGGEMSWGSPGPPAIWTCLGNIDGCGAYTGWSQSNGSQLNITPGELGIGDVYGHTPLGSTIEVRWTSPLTGLIDVSGAVWALRDLDFRANDWALTLNGSLLASGTVGSGDPYSRALPALFGQSLAVGVGDILAFTASPSPSGAVGDYIALDLQITQVPEPASLLLLGTGLIGAVRAVRRRRR